MNPKSVEVSFEHVKQQSEAKAAGTSVCECRYTGRCGHVAEPMETNSPCTFVPTKEYLLTTLTSLATHISVVQVVAMEIMRFLTSPTGKSQQFIPKGGPD